MKKSRPSRKDSAEGTSKCPAFPSLLPRFLSRLQDLSSQLAYFKSTHDLEAEYRYEPRMEAYQAWLQADAEYHENWVLSGLELDRTQETPLTFLSDINVYEGFGLKWRLRFSDRAMNRLEESSEDRKMRLIERLLDLARGNFDLNRRSTLLTCGPMRQLVAFSNLVTREDILVLATELSKAPIIDDGKLVGFAYEQCMRVVDIVVAEDRVPAVFKQYINLLRTDPAKMIYPTQELRDDRLVSLDNSLETLEKGLFGPKPCANDILTEAEKAKYSYHPELLRWVHSSMKLKEAWQDAQLTKANANLIAELADSESCTLFIRFLQAKVKAFPFQLSEEELDVVGTPGNVLAIGRSGTGKTTCALLRLLASHALFRTRLRQQSRTADGLFGLHIIFITASPTLSIEVKRFYDNLVTALSGKKASQAPAPAADDDTEMNEKDLEIKPSMSLMTHSDFPLFSTTRLLVFAIDASLRNPFFKVTEAGESVAVQTGFHNELRGVRVISHLIRSEELDDNYDFQKEEASYTAFEEEKEGEERKEEALGENLSFEVDFDYFEKRFWPIVKIKGSLSASLVWAEISGRIKGAASSHSYARGHISKEIYLTQHKKTSLLSTSERESVWAVFQQYEKWKEMKSAYDFQDVVTHALKEVELAGYEGAPVHFMMVDEVQDLTHATLLLLGKVTEQNLFFSGDTAQTIAKGITFRFKDLGTLFASQEGLAIQQPCIKQLLVNYRSHQKILTLANCVVRVIELLFPKTIDKLAREVSNDPDGPIPMVLLNPCLEDIVNALVAGERADKGEVTFGYGQVVLVPDETARKRLPAILKGALCLTIYESKGLEFDDVILFEFFANCGVAEDQWKILHDILYDERGNIAEDIYASDWKPKCAATFDAVKHAALCTALKMLYVAITRTKEKFIIYDQSFSAHYLLDYMIAKGMVTHVVPKESGLRTDLHSTVQSEQGKVLWRNQGIKMMKMKFYSQAAICFMHAQDDLLRNKAETLHSADETSKILQAAEAILEDRKSNEEAKTAGENDVRAAIQEFSRLARAFQHINQLKYAAQCFFSAREYLNAAGIYKGLKLWNELGDCLFSAGEYEQAARSYLQASNFLSALRAYEKGQMWEKCLQVFEQIKGKYSLRKRVSWIRRYYQKLAESHTSKLVYSTAVAQPSTAEEITVNIKFTSQLTFSRPRPLLSNEPLTSRERYSVLSGYSSYDQILSVSEAALIDMERETANGNLYAYSYLQNKAASPAGCPIATVDTFVLYQAVQKLVEIAGAYEEEAQLLTTGRRMVPHSGQFGYNRLPGNISQAISILERLDLRKAAFIIANAFNLDNFQLECLERLAVSVSALPFLKTVERYSEPYRRFGRLWGVVAAKECTEAWKA